MEAAGLSLFSPFAGCIVPDPDSNAPKVACPNAGAGGVPLADFARVHQEEKELIKAHDSAARRGKELQANVRTTDV